MTIAIIIFSFLIAIAGVVVTNISARKALFVREHTTLQSEPKAVQPQVEVYDLLQLIKALDSKQDECNVQLNDLRSQIKFIKKDYTKKIDENNDYIIQQRLNNLIVGTSLYNQSLFNFGTDNFPSIDEPKTIQYSQTNYN